MLKGQFTNREARFRETNKGRCSFWVRDSREPWPPLGMKERGPQGSTEGSYMLEASGKEGQKQLARRKLKKPCLLSSQIPSLIRATHRLELTRSERTREPIDVGRTSQPPGAQGGVHRVE